MRHFQVLLTATVFSVASFFACSKAVAELRTKTVEYSFQGQKMQGYLAWDDEDAKKRPGVLVVHEWWGLNDYAKKRADEFAKMGYVAFAADMYGEGRAASHPDDAAKLMEAVKKDKAVWVGRAKAAYDVLKSDARVDAERIAAIGYCFGGATVLELAYSGLPVAGVVSLHGALSAPSAEQAKNVKAKILVCHGAADPFVKEEAALGLRKALDSARADYQFIYYGNTEHSFTVPTAPGANGMVYSPLADKRSAAHVQVFFDEIFEGR